LSINGNNKRISDTANQIGQPLANGSPAKYVLFRRETLFVIDDQRRWEKVHGLPASICNTQHRRAGRVLYLYPALASARAVGEIASLRDDTLQTELAGMLKYFGAVALGPGGGSRQTRRNKTDR
jgi:hypothetical protein